MSLEKILESYKKQSIAIRYFMLGRKFYTAVGAMDFASEYHVNTRKDGVTPEFMHQVEIANYVRTLPLDDVMLQDVLIAVFLHDVHEDYNVSFALLVEKFGAVHATNSVTISKIRDGQKISQNKYYADLTLDPVLAIAKGADRVHNVTSMHTAFTPAKQLRYITDTEQHVMPMLKTARRKFPEQEAAFENIKHVLMSHIELIRAIHTTPDPEAE